MNTRIGNLLADLKKQLRVVYGPRLRGVCLFGSYARGDADAESDADVLILLDEISSYGAEVFRTSGITSEVSLKYGVTVSRVFAAEKDWLTADCPFLNNVRSEAVPA